MTLHHKIGPALIIAIAAIASLAFAQEVGMRPAGCRSRRRLPLSRLPW